MTCPICEKTTKPNRRFCSRKCAGLFGSIQSRAGKVTDIERKVAAYLHQEAIPYVCDKAVARTSIPDFIVGKVLIYCDGLFWHSRKKAQYRDKKINDKLTKLGYTVIRFTGTQINKDFIKVAKTITDTVNNNLT